MLEFLQPAPAAWSAKCEDAETQTGARLPKAFAGLTHAHADHAAGLVKGAPCPVYATTATWGLLSRLPIRDRRTMPLRKAVVIGGIRFSAIPVQRSMRAPAVGYRVSAKDCCFFYLPDVAELPKA